MATLAGYRTGLTAFTESFDATELLASEAEAIVRDATAIVNLASTVRMLAAKRVADSPTWKHRGHRTPAEWLAKETKCGVGDAIGALETAGKLAECPQVEARARLGGLSGEQSRALTRAVSVDPAAEASLMKVAEEDGLTTLRGRCRDIELAAAGDAEARHARIHRERSLRHWTDDDGSFRLAAKLTADAGARVLGALAPFEKTAFDQARADGRRETAEAYRADGLVGLCQASLSDDTPVDGKPRCRKPSYTVLVDAAALLRGHVEAGETCEIPGVGPIPVSVLLEQPDQAIWHILATHGVDIRSYASATRHIPTMLRVALEARDRECVVPGCNQTLGLEIDHIIPIEEGGRTTYDNIARECHHDHHENKHRRGWKLDGKPGDWTFTSPPQIDAPDVPDPP